MSPRSKVVIGVAATVIFVLAGSVDYRLTI
jgi:hypothetical protein